MLLDAGYPVALAEQLAQRCEIDLHQAVTLLARIRELGKPAQLAAEILL